MEKNERKTMMREKTRQTSWMLEGGKIESLFYQFLNLLVFSVHTHMNTTSRMTLSNLTISQKVLMRRSANRKVYCTYSMQRYRDKESRMFTPQNFPVSLSLSEIYKKC